MAFDFERAKQYASLRLEQELPPNLSYHNLLHTVADVVPAAVRLAESENVTGESLLLLLTAAYYHDLGFVEDRMEHEAIAVRMIGEALPRFGYNDGQITLIGGIIMATRLPQSPTNLLEAILADADLDVLGRDDFLEKNHDLRAELAAYGQLMDDYSWYSTQLEFIRNHTYFTVSARELRDAQKSKNILRLEQLIADC